MKNIDSRINRVAVALISSADPALEAHKLLHGGPRALRKGALRALRWLTEAGRDTESPYRGKREHAAYLAWRAWLYAPRVPPKPRGTRHYAYITIDRCTPEGQVVHVDCYAVDTYAEISAAKAALRDAGLESAPVYAGAPDDPDSYESGQILWSDSAEIVGRGDYDV
jgi:hypothetical protein